MSGLRREDVFATIEPPPGGLTRLRARLDERNEPARFPWRVRVAWIVAATAGVAIVLQLAPPPSEAPALASTPGLVRLGVGVRPHDAVSVAPAERDRVAVLAVAETPQVVFYRVATLTPDR